MTEYIDATNRFFAKYPHGDSLPIYLEETDQNGAPIDYTGYVVRFAIGSTINESTSGVTATHTGTSGTISIFVPDTVMDDLSVGEYNMAIEIYYAAINTRRTLCIGTLQIVEDVRT